MTNQGKAGPHDVCPGTLPTRVALMAVTYLGPAAQVPGHCLAGYVVPHELVILAGHLGQQLLHLHQAHIGKAHKLLGIHRAAESADQAFAIQEGDYDPDDRGNHGSLHDGGTHVPGAGERNGWVNAGSFLLIQSLDGCRLSYAKQPSQSQGADSQDRLQPPSS